MKRLNSRDRVPGGVPKGWRDPKTDVFIAWRDTVHFNTFYSQVVKFYQNNNMAYPSEAEVEDYICRTIAKIWCNGQTAQVVAAPAQVTRGCRTCGGRRR